MDCEEVIGSDKTTAKTNMKTDKKIPDKGWYWEVV